MTERFKDNNSWQELVGQKNAYYRGVFASRKYAVNGSELPSAPRTVTQQEKMYWYMGVQDGLAGICSESSG